MTKGQLIELLANMPDDTQVFVTRGPHASTPKIKAFEEADGDSIYFMREEGPDTVHRKYPGESGGWGEIPLVPRKRVQVKK